VQQSNVVNNTRAAADGRFLICFRLAAALGGRLIRAFTGTLPPRGGTGEHVAPRVWRATAERAFSGTSDPSSARLPARPISRLGGGLLSGRARLSAEMKIGHDGTALSERRFKATLSRIRMIRPAPMNGPNSISQMARGLERRCWNGIGPMVGGRLDGLPRRDGFCSSDMARRRRFDTLQKARVCVLGSGRTPVAGALGRAVPNWWT
jgi:hypothetical protein